MRANRRARALMSHDGADARPRPSERRRHDADGISTEAGAIIDRHGLDRGKILDIAKGYGPKKGVDFNEAPARDFEGAPLGDSLLAALESVSTFDAFRHRLISAIDSLDYDTSDGIIDRIFVEGAIVDNEVKNIYRDWKRHAERLEGLNVALHLAAEGAPYLFRFIGSLGELDNYRRGKWRQAGDAQDRVPATVGVSNVFLDRGAAAKVSYSAAALAGWTQPVRYSPYQRNPDEGRERFGGEKSGHFAGECEVHIHAGCPIPAREHIKIALLPRCGLGRREVVERYGDVGIVE